jgi:hypothetical protein
MKAQRFKKKEQPRKNKLLIKADQPGQKENDANQYFIGNNDKVISEKCINVKGSKIELQKVDLAINSPKIGGNLGILCSKKEDNNVQKIGKGVDIQRPKKGLHNVNFDINLPKIGLPNVDYTSKGFRYSLQKKGFVDINGPKRFRYTWPKKNFVDINQSTKLRHSWPKKGLPNLDIDMKTSKICGVINTNSPKIDISDDNIHCVKIDSGIKRLNLDKNGTKVRINTREPKLEVDYHGMDEQGINEPKEKEEKEEKIYLSEYLVNHEINGYEQVPYYIDEKEEDSNIIKGCQNVINKCDLLLPIILIEDEFYDKFCDFIDNYVKYEEYKNIFILKDKLI